MIIEVSEREAYLIHRIRSDYETGKTVFSIMDCPLDERDLNERKEISRSRIRGKADALRQQHIKVFNSIGKPYKLKYLNEIETKCRDEILESDQYWDSLQERNTENMRRWLLTQTGRKLIHIVPEGGADNGKGC